METFMFSTNGNWQLFNPDTKVTKEGLKLEPDWTLAHILVDIGMFPSVNQARKNGFKQEIEQGHSQFKIGKRMINIFKDFKE